LIGLLRKLTRKLFYDPLNMARNNPYIRMDQPRPFTIDFLASRTDVGFVAGEDCVLCEIGPLPFSAPRRTPLQIKEAQ
jgi:hypothetical protein